MAPIYEIKLSGEAAIRFERNMKRDEILYEKKESKEVYQKRNCLIISQMPDGIDLTKKLSIIDDVYEVSQFSGWTRTVGNSAHLKEAWNLSMVMESISAKKAILYNQFLREVGSKKRIATSGQLEKNLNLIKGQCVAGDGLVLFGHHLNPIENEVANYLIKQFQKRGLAQIDDLGRLIKPIKMDLYGLELDRKTGQINLTDESIYREAPELISESFKFNERDAFGVPIKDVNGERTANTHLDNSGLNTVAIWDDLRFNYGLAFEGNGPNSGRIITSE